MNEALLNYTGHLFGHVILIAVTTAALILAMVIDLFFGIRKAKQRGEATTSQGFKKTCEKARKYFSPYLVLICIDLLACVLVPVPAFSMLWAAYCIFCEFVSVREKSWQKEELRKAEKTMNVIIENKDDLAKLVAAVLFQQEQARAAMPATVPAVEPEPAPAVLAEPGELEATCGSETCAYRGKGICHYKANQFCPMYVKKQ